MDDETISEYVTIFFFNDTATTEIYTLSLHDALPISFRRQFPIENLFTDNGNSSKLVARRMFIIV